MSRSVRVYDLRSEEKKPLPKTLDITDMDINYFLQLLHKEFGFHPGLKFSLVTTDRVVLDFDKFKELKDGSTLYLLKDKNQDLATSTEENITYTPHFRTLTEAGTYEYHTSEGNKSLPSALAELVDNSLSATAQNDGLRNIDIRMMFDESIGKPAVVVLDNGCGMTSNKLNNWAVYKLSKFIREDSMFTSQQERYVRPDHVPRSLNSDLSYFGVGGKQAIFFIGTSVRMITKQAGSPDVHELIMSEEDFEKKVKDKADVFSGTIKNRKPGDSSHVTSKDERFLHNLIAEERGKESFTAVIITGLKPATITFMRNEFDVLTRQLAHIFHYYIHGINGNCQGGTSTNQQEPKMIQIDISLTKKQGLPKVRNLREVSNDMQSLYIDTAVDTFEFRVSVPNVGEVEGLIRYHPFLYDKETYPQGPTAEQASTSENNAMDNESETLNRARGKKPIFECFWNGRLIPSTTVSEFSWCSASSKASNVPVECYDRLSGVLFTDDHFKVTQNKLTFMDLELTLKDKEAIYKIVTNGQLRRGDIKKEFTAWLQKCHKEFDKQVKFVGFQETIERNEPRVHRHWSTFSAIEWDGKTFKAGQLVKSKNTNPILHGKVIRFLLHGIHNEDVFATGGEVEIIREPQGLYDTTKNIPISKINKNATVEEIQKSIDGDSLKLPDQLQVEWPGGNILSQNAVWPAGSPIGPIQVEIRNSKRESLSKMPGGPKSPALSVELSIVQHGPKGDKKVEGFTARHSGKRAYWFHKYEKLTVLGKYSLLLNAVVNENATRFGGKTLPSHTVKFTITSAEASKFVVDAVGPNLRVGEPFNIPLNIKDAYGHPAAPPAQLTPSLVCSDLDLVCKGVKINGATLTITGVIAKGKAQNNQTPMGYELKVTLPGLKNDTQTIKINLLPGVAHSLHVTPEENPIKLENGNQVMFDVEVHDEAGNITANPRQIVQCKIADLPPHIADCSRTGTGKLVAKAINRKIVNGEPQMLKVTFELRNQKTVLPVTRELKVVPSTRISMMELLSGDNKNLVLRNKEMIEWPAGGCLENLLYKLYDEAGREVELTPEIASMIKVSWDGDCDELAQGKLPDIQVSTEVSKPQSYLVSYQGRGVSVSFTIVSLPGEPAHLKATVPQNTVKLGETMERNINLELVDYYNNATKTLNPASVNIMTVEAEGLDKSALTFEWQESSSSVAVTGVRFHAGAPGPRNMLFRYNEYEERVMMEVTAGVPAKLQLVSAPVQPLQFLNYKGSPTPFVVLLCDEWGNPSPEERVVFEVKSSPLGLKVMTSVTSQPVGEDGKASITLTSVSGPKGYYSLTFQGSFNNKPITGPSVYITVIPDPNKPVRLSFQGDTTARFPAGGTFPVFSVAVVSDEGRPIGNIAPTALSMLLWKENAPPEEHIELRCNRPLENDPADCFYFRDKTIPESVGKHIIQFSLKVTETELLQSDQIPINVVANQPDKLAPDSDIPTPVVSLSENNVKRTLVENLTLRIRDSYGNPAGESLDGKVVVTVKCRDGQTKKVPLFEGKINQVQFLLVEGKAHIPRLAIMENSPYENGAEYILVFKPELMMDLMSLTPFELTFHFYSENQQKLSELTQKKVELTGAIGRFETMFHFSNELLQLMTDKLKTASKKEADQRRELDRRGVTFSQTVSIPTIDQLISEKEAQCDDIQSSRRCCTVQDLFAGQQDVLGKVCHLALVQDDAAARVISWLMSGFMQCVVTKTTEAAKRICDDTQDNQQVLALDSVYVPPGNRLLPHRENGGFNPSGNPVFARELLIYPQHKEQCEAVFKNLLGNTIVIDDLQSANQYRRAVVQRKMKCPTILTREGGKVSGNGIFGGSQNRAPPIGRLTAFGAPPPRQHQTLKEEIELLVQYRSAVKNREEAEEERNIHRATMNSPKYLQDKQKMEDQTKELEEIDRQLESMQASLGRRRLPAAADSGDPTAKRPRMTT